MTGEEFVAQLQREIDRILSKLEEVPVVPPGQESRTAIIDLLKFAMKSEIEASEIAAYWLPTTPELDVKLGLARQCGDEAKHFWMIQDRLKELGVDASNHNPIAHGHSRSYQYLRSLHGTAERLAAGPFAREAVAYRRNRQFIAYLEQVADEGTARLYRDTIQPDEDFHHLFGVRKLQKYANTPEAQSRAREAVQRTLELDDELREVFVGRMGTIAIPGC